MGAFIGFSFLARTLGAALPFRRDQRERRNKGYRTPVGRSRAGDVLKVIKIESLYLSLFLFFDKMFEILFNEVSYETWKKNQTTPLEQNYQS